MDSHSIDGFRVTRVDRDRRQAIASFLGTYGAPSFAPGDNERWIACGPMGDIIAFLALTPFDVNGVLTTVTPPDRHACRVGLQLARDVATNRGLRSERALRLPWDDTALEARFGDRDGMPYSLSDRDRTRGVYEHYLAVDSKLVGALATKYAFDDDGTPLIVYVSGSLLDASSWLPLLRIHAERGERALAVDLPSFGLADRVARDRGVIDGYGDVISETVALLSSFGQIELRAHGVAAVAALWAAIVRDELHDRLLRLVLLQPPEQLRASMRVGMQPPVTTVLRAAARWWPESLASVAGRVSASRNVMFPTHWHRWLLSRPYVGRERAIETLRVGEWINRVLAGAPLPVPLSGVPTLVVQSRCDMVSANRWIPVTHTVRVAKIYGGHCEHLGDYRALLDVIERNWPEQHASPS